MPFCNGLTPEIISVLLAISSIGATANLSTEDKADLARIIIYIGQSMAVEASLELREEAQLKAEAQMSAIKKQIDSLNEQLEDMKKRLKK